MRDEDRIAKALAPALGAVRRAAADEQRAEALAAYEVGYERGFLAGYEAAERDRERREDDLGTPP